MHLLSYPFILERGVVPPTRKRTGQGRGSGCAWRPAPSRSATCPPFSGHPRGGQPCKAHGTRDVSLPPRGVARLGPSDWPHGPGHYGSPAVVATLLAPPSTLGTGSLSWPCPLPLPWLPSDALPPFQLPSHRASHSSWSAGASGISRGSILFRPTLSSLCFGNPPAPVHRHRITLTRVSSGLPEGPPSLPGGASPCVYLGMDPRGLGGAVFLMGFPEHPSLRQVGGSFRPQILPVSMGRGEGEPQPGGWFPGTEAAVEPEPRPSDSEEAPRSPGQRRPPE